MLIWIEEEEESAELKKLNTQDQIVKRQQYLKMVEMEREKCAVNKIAVQPVAPPPVVEEKKEEDEEEKSK